MAQKTAETEADLRENKDNQANAEKALKEDRDALLTALRDIDIKILED